MRKTTAVASGTGGAGGARCRIRNPRPRLQGDVATTRADCTGDEFLVEGDPDLLRSAVENVVRSATRYTAEGTKQWRCDWNGSRPFKWQRVSVVRGLVHPAPASPRMR